MNIQEMSTVERLNAARKVAEEYRKVTRIIKEFDDSKFYQVRSLTVGGNMKYQESRSVSDIPEFDRKKVFEQTRWVIYGELKRLQESFQEIYQELISNVSLEEETNNVK